MRTHRRGRQSGLTLIELLVTIIIAGIAFAAILPVFVQALQSNSADKTRNVALNIAQAKMELIRELDFAQIDVTTPDPASAASPKDPLYLGSPTFHNGDFRPTYRETTEGAGEKTFWVHYTVTAFKNAPTDSQPSYKRVRVEVGWDGNPKPLKTAVLDTIIYSQWGGPRIAYFNVGPLDADNVIRTTGNIRLKAILNPADIERTTVVKFAINSLGGGEVVAWQEGQVDPADATGGTWYFDWPAANAADEGGYTFQAIAYDGVDAGNTAHRTYRFDAGSPGGPTGLTADPGDRTVLLRWDPSAVGDLAYYQVWRIESADYITTSPETPIDQQPQATQIDGGKVLSQPLFLATGLMNDTLYRFFVRSVDSQRNFSAWAECQETPNNLDQTPPAAPTDLWLSVIGPTATLSWTPSADAVFYRIYTWNGAAATLVPGEAGISLGSSRSMSQGYSKTAYYQVRGVDTAGNEQQQAGCTLRLVPATPSALLGGITWATATTLAPPQFNMTLQNMFSHSVRVTVVWLQDGASTAPARQVTITSNTNIAAGQTKDLKTQYAGLLLITWTSSGTEDNADGDSFVNFNSAMRIAIPVL